MWENMGGRDKGGVEVAIAHRNTIRGMIKKYKKDAGIKNPLGWKIKKRGGCS